MSLDNPIEVATYIAWEEYYAQLARISPKRIRGKGNGPWEHKHFKQFKAIAERCHKLGMGVRQYIEEAFLIQRGYNKRFILPRDLCADWIIERVHGILNNDVCPATYAAQWAQQLELLELLQTTQQAVFPDAVSALMVPANAFELWFRVLVLTPFNDDLFNVYGRAAHLELKGSRELRNFLRRQVPDNLAELQLRLGSFGDG